MSQILRSNFLTYCSIHASDLLQYFFFLLQEAVVVVVVETVGHQEVEEVCVTLTRRASATEDLLADSPTKFNSPICNLSDRIG